MSKLGLMQEARDHKELTPMRPSPFAVRDAWQDDRNDAASAVLSAWLAPRTSTRRPLVATVKRLMKHP